jgi:DNA-binding NtrC family response regulator
MASSLNLRSGCILVVDDDEATVLAYKTVLMARQYKVLTASHFFDAIKFLERRDLPIDVLITDIVLDSGNGFALARIGRMHRPIMKTVYITGHDVPMEEAAGTVLRKPITDEALIKAVRTAQPY